MGGLYRVEVFKMKSIFVEERIRERDRELSYSAPINIVFASRGSLFA